MTSPSLLGITALARAGALDHAWRRFQEAGLEAVVDDAAVLSVKGRLLKDRGRLAQGEARRAFYAGSAEAYGAAGAISWATYPLINAATLHLLAGEPARSAALAEKVLARLDRGDAEPDTPYWREATRAEAELLLGRTHEAWLTLQGAVALAPRAWEDHAATLRQFALILAERGEDAAWLEPLRPPRTLHFAGQMGLDPDDRALAGAVAETLEAERVGFGYGALAAGSDIVIAEALLARGAELHLVLPAARSAFRAVSVAPFGQAWAGRFDAVLARAETVTVAGDADPPTPLDLQLAARTAMGRAAMQAEVLATEAVQLIVTAAGAPAAVTLEGGTPEDAADGGSLWAARAWRAAGRRGLALSSRRAIDTPPAAGLSTPPGWRLAAVLALAPAPEAPFEAALAAVWSALAQAEAAPAAPPSWIGEALLLAFDDPAVAASAAGALLAAKALAAPRIAGAYGTVRRLPQPHGPDLLFGSPVETAGRLLASVPPGSACVTAPFAAALAAQAAIACEPIGELPPRDPSDLDADRDPTVFGLRLQRSPAGGP